MPQPASLLKKETLAQVFSCEFCEIYKNAFSYRTPALAASICTKSIYLPLYCQPVQFVMQFRYAILLAV